MFSPVDPHILYYAANFVFKTTDGGQNWQIISPDLARPHPGIPASLGNLAAKDPKADKQRGVVYALAPSFQERGHALGRYRRWDDLDDARRRKELEGHHATRADRLEQSDADFGASHFDDETAYASVSRFRIDDLHPYIYRTHDGGKTWQAHQHGPARQSPPWTRCAKIPREKVCSSPGRKRASGCRSMTAITGNRCN